MSSNFVNYYKVLQVDPEAETEVIEGAYRRLALKYHPDIDKSPGADEKMKLINEARRILTNPQERRRYDQQFNQNSLSQSPQNTSRHQETVDDRWDDNSARTLAAQLLMIIQGNLNEKKWRIAKEKLYAFEGLGISSKEGPLPTFAMSFPEWQNANKLNDLANQQANEFGINLRKSSFWFYGVALGITGLVIMLGNYTNVSDVSAGMMLVGGGFGAIVGAIAGLLAGLIGSLIYSHWFAGKWGEGTDNVFGVLTPVIIALVITVGIYAIMAYIIIRALLSSASSSSSRR